jgi:hypothetical protein
MSWYDYVPGVGSIARAAQGDWGQAAEDVIPGVRVAGDVGKYAYQKLYKDPAANKAAALDAASAQAKALGGDVWGKAMQGKNDAMAQYAPADAAYKALYGDPASWTKAKAPPPGGGGGGIY